MASTAAAPPRQRHNSRGDPFLVFECARNHGAEGRRWVEANLSGRTERIARSYVNSVAVMRQKGLADGRAMLDQGTGEMSVVSTSTDPAMLAVLERWLQSALGYYYYALKDLDRAEDAMVRAHEAIVIAVSLQPILLPFAVGCSELYLHRARIASARRQWKVMEEHLRRGTEMGVGMIPLCIRLDGTPVALDDVQRFIRALPAEVTAEWDDLAYIFDNDVIRRYFDRSARQIYGKSAPVVPYD